MSAIKLHIRNFALKSGAGQFEGFGLSLRFDAAEIDRALQIAGKID